MWVGGEAVFVFVFAIVGEGLIAARFVATDVWFIAHSWAFVERIHCMFFIRSERCESIPCWLQAGAVGLVTYVCFSGLATLEEPLKAPAHILDEVPDVESVDECFRAKGTSVVGIVGIGIQAWDRF